MSQQKKKKWWWPTKEGIKRKWRFWRRTYDVLLGGLMVWNVEPPMSDTDWLLFVGGLVLFWKGLVKWKTYILRSKSTPAPSYVLSPVSAKAEG